MPRNKLPRLLLGAMVLAVMAPERVLAAQPKTSITDRPQSCRAVLDAPVPESQLTPEQAEDGRLHVHADHIEMKLGESAVFSGAVELRYGEVHLFADEVTHQQDGNLLDARGRIHLRRDTGETILAPNLRYELDTERGRAEDARFAFAEGLARGDAKRVYLEGRDTINFESVRYTTCPPERDDWFLRASRLKLDKADDTGTAYHTVIEFFHVPVFYSPYLSFPLSDARRTGFLAPHVGQGTNTGLLVAVPYYINLAPNIDDTVTLRVLGRRGAQLLNETRYLGKQYDGRLDMEYLPNDRVTDTDRQAFFFQHDHSLSQHWSLESEIKWVSDNNYFIDLGAASVNSSLTHLPRFARLDYGDNTWRFMGRVYTYQTLDTTIPLVDIPYQRLPQLSLHTGTPVKPNRVHLSLDSEWTYFYRQGGNVAGQPGAGQRFDAQPGISLPLRTSYVYFTPKASYRYTSWNLTDATGDETPERGLPVYSVDSGLAFERDGNWLGKAFTQTLEPRLFYVHIPYRNQDSLPVFDTTIPEFSFFNFFRENRFVGGDRVGDTRQLTTAVTSRFLLPDNGIEQARVSIGQVLYFEDQRVNLPANTVSQSRSDLIGEAYARIGAAWYTRGDLQWDSRKREARKGNIYLHYRPGKDRIINLGYRHIDDPTLPSQEIADVSSQWPITERWSGLARWNYSLPDENTIQAYAGIGYTSCCWGLRALYRQRILPDGSEDKGVLFEFELSGLSRLGEAEESPFKQSKFIFE